MQNDNSNNFSKLIDNLFRRDSGKITSILTSVFGIENFDLVEDVVQDTILKALRQWPYSGIPDNPTGWLLKSAKNRTIDILRQRKIREKYSDRISSMLASEYSLSGKINEFFSENEIRNGQLRMIFTCCHPDLPGESQVALALKYLCGFSVKEIAKAFLTNEETITKRLSRAKEKLSSGRVKFEIPAGNELEVRLGNVLSTLYLLFNEGYNSASSDRIIKEELMDEAVWLTEFLLDQKITSLPEVHALLSLMLFHYSRTPARIDDNGNILLIKEQDRKLWDNKMIRKAKEHLNLSASGGKITEYHLEAGIAYFYTTSDFDKIEWGKILNLYNLLYDMNKSVIIGLNRVIVIAQLEGAEKGLTEISKLTDKDKLENYHLYYSTLGELYFQNNQKELAAESYLKALSLTLSEAERKLLMKKLNIVQ